MKISVGYGKGEQECLIRDESIIGILQPNPIENGFTGAEEVRKALASPIGTASLRDLISAGESVVIITSDITRPFPSMLVIPEILEELSHAGIRDSDVTVVFALGSHRKHTVAEMKALVGETVFQRVRCVDSDAKDCQHLGVTTGGTPVDIFTLVAKADRRICLGNIEYHYFAGYSGGIKAIMPGVSTRAAIQANHSRMVDEAAKAGEMDSNPVRMDMEEVLSMIPVDFLLNVVLDEHKIIVHATAGHCIQAHRAGCAFLDRLYKINIQEKADIVVVSAGGFPKDINLYQAQKALDNAKHAVREGGIIILAARCGEGYGEKVFQEWINRAQKPSDWLEEIERNFELGGHKAAAIGMVLKKSRIFLISEMQDERVRKVFLEPFADLQAAADEAFSVLGPDSTVMIMPNGGSTLPVVTK